MHRFKNILYVHDESSDVCEKTLQLAIDLAERNEGRVDLIFVIERKPTIISSSSLILLHERLLKWARKSLRELTDSVTVKVELRTKVIEGIPHVEVIRDVLRNDHDLVIKPIGSDDFMDRLLGRLDMRLLRHCPCPVWLSKGDSYGAFDSVLAAVGLGDPGKRDLDSAINKQIVELAFSLCAASNAVLHMGHVWFPSYLMAYGKSIASLKGTDIDDYVSGEKDLRQGWLDGLMSKAADWVEANIYDAVDRHTHLRQGHVGQEIAKLIVDVEANVVILGTVARSGMAGVIMGNKAEAILEQVTCSVLAIKPPGFVTQVELED
ncbi:MAG: universal stress protein [Rhizobiales bacterium]|nr:universal stress protein [Hyphomicrobiales bacterium]